MEKEPSPAMEMDPESLTSLQTALMKLPRALFAWVWEIWASSAILATSSALVIEKILP
jgi:hypothetical protein